MPDPSRDDFDWSDFSPLVASAESTAVRVLHARERMAASIESPAVDVRKTHREHMDAVKTVVARSGKGACLYRYVLDALKVSRVKDKFILNIPTLMGVGGDDVRDLCKLFPHDLKKAVHRVDAPVRIRFEAHKASGVEIAAGERILTQSAGSVRPAFILEGAVDDSYCYIYHCMGRARQHSDVNSISF